MLVEINEFEGVSFDPKKVSTVTLSHTKIRICFDNGGSIATHADDENTANELYQ